MIDTNSKAKTLGQKETKAFKAGPNHRIHEAWQAYHRVLELRHRPCTADLQVCRQGYLITSGPDHRPSPPPSPPPGALQAMALTRGPGARGDACLPSHTRMSLEERHGVATRHTEIIQKNLCQWRDATATGQILQH